MSWYLAAERTVRLDIERTKVVHAPAEAVWRILGPGFASPERWARQVSATRPDPASTPRGQLPVSGRICETDVGPLTDRIVHYDAREMAIAYTVEGTGFPSHVRQVVQQWRVSALARKCSLVDLRLAVDMTPFSGHLFGWMLDIQLGMMMNAACLDLRHFAECGVPHPKKPIPPRAGSWWG